MKTLRQTIIDVLTEHARSLTGKKGVDRKRVVEVVDAILKESKARAVVELTGGNVTAVYSDVPLQVIMRDFDNIEAGNVDPMSGADLSASEAFNKVY